jgi:DNA-binding beta-propeller fold protein YncE
VLGCLVVAALVAPARAQRPASRDLVWPPPPEAARIRYVGSLGSEVDLGRRESFFTRFKRAVAGGAAPALLRLQRPFDVHTRDGVHVYFTNGSLGAVMLFDRSTRRGRLLGGDVPGGLAKPMGLGGDSVGNLYVADPGTKRVVVFGADGRYRHALGGPSLLLNPVDVAVDEAAGRIYVVDSYLHQVIVFDSAGGVIGRLGKQAGSLDTRQRATAAARDTQSALPEDHVASRGDPSDVWENRGGQAGEFRYPVSAAVSADGTLYVSDQMNFRVQAFDRAGRFVRQIGGLGDVPGSFTRPKGVAVDGAGHLYVVDAAFSNVQVFNAAGQLLLSFGSLGRGEGMHWLPLGVSIDRQDRIWVVDRYNNRAQLYEYLPGPPDSVGGDHGRP